MNETVTWFLDHSHTTVVVCGAVSIGIFLLIRDVLPLIRKSAPHKRHKAADPNALATEFLRLAALILIIALAVRVDQLGRHITRDLDELRKEAAQSDVHRFKELRDHLDPNLEKIFGDHIERELDSVSKAIESGQITLASIDEFRLLYKETLKRFPKATFLATSLPSKAYFWRDPTIDAAIDEFIKSGGQMTRIFFLPGDAPDTEAVDIMNRQARTGVVVYYIRLADVPTDLHKLYMVDTEGRLAWQASIDAANEITYVTVNDT